MVVVSSSSSRQQCSPSSVEGRVFFKSIVLRSFGGNEVEARRGLIFVILELKKQENLVFSCFSAIFEVFLGIKKQENHVFSCLSCFLNFFQDSGGREGQA